MKRIGINKKKIVDTIKEIGIAILVLGLVVFVIWAKYKMDVLYGRY